MKSIISHKGFVCAVIVGGAVGCAGQVSSSGSDEATAVSSASLGCDPPSRALDSKARFFVPPPDPGAVAQIAALRKAKRYRDALGIAAMVETPRAAWFVGGTPEEVRSAVQSTMASAAREHRVPVLVAYNIPFRDCSQYSAGGASDTASYEAWIDGFVAGIGSGKAVVLVEPDGLGIIPYNTTIYGATDWCKPTITDADGNVVPAPGADPDSRYEQMNYAVAALESKAPAASVYLDGTHSAWLGVGEAASRLARAGVQSAQGFFLNVSNYQPSDQLIQFGAWVSDCITAATAGAPWAAGHFDWCPSQYNPATNYSIDYSAAYAATVTAALENMMGGAAATTHFVIDTSRNGNGAFDAAPYAVAPYSQPANVIAALNAGNWCNPPSAGLGTRPTADSGVPLLDAYLWVKVPGESDGSCDIAGGARAWDYAQYNPWDVAADAQSHFDPLWAMVDPAAGAWFPEQALALVANANPPVFPPAK
jgi:endoglucanase